MALHVGMDTLPMYQHRYAPHKYTQPQLFACLVLMVFEAGTIVAWKLIGAICRSCGHGSA
ncbi:MAG: hypothetical protein HC898_09095 [Phycisphaerales bacterium]|nr:hypothetical protein [Phycisphaerales bacterium]